MYMFRIKMNLFIYSHDNQPVFSQSDLILNSFDTGTEKLYLKISWYFLKNNRKKLVTNIDVRFGNANP